MELKQILPICLAWMMFVMGSSLKLNDFFILLNKPLASILALSCQLVLLPLFAVGIAMMLQVDAQLALGLVLVASCPGGITSNFFTRICNGDSALSIALTAITSLSSVVLLPFWMGWSSQLFEQSTTAVQLSFWQTLQQLALVNLLPVVVGMIAYQLAPNWLGRAQRGLVTSAGLMFFGIMLAMWWQQWAYIQASAQQAGILVILLVAVSMSFTQLIARVSRLAQAQKTTLVFEVGLQNSATAFFVAMAVLKTPSLAVPATVYSVVMILAAVIYGAYIRAKSVVVGQPVTENTTVGSLE